MRMTDRVRNILLLTVLGVALVLVFGTTLPSEFVYDSIPIVRDHEMVKDDLPIWRAFAQSYWGDTRPGGLYRPLTILCYVLERRGLGVEAAWPHAVVNIALHGLVVVLLYRLTLAWSGRVGSAVVAAALFAVHPIAAEVVPNLVGRADLLATAAVLGALLAWERWLRGGRNAWLAATLGLWVAGLLSKESAVALPAIAYVRHVWWMRETGDGGWDESRGVLRGVGPMVARTNAYLVLAATGAAWLAVRDTVLARSMPVIDFGLDNPLVNASLAERLMTVSVLWAIALRSAVLPAWLSVDYSPGELMPVVSPADPRLWAALLAVAGLVVLIVVCWRRRSPAFLGLALFVLAFLPVSNLLILIGTIMADRLVYLPLAGVCVAAGVGAGMVWDAVRGAGSVKLLRGAMAGAVSAAVVVLGARTWERSEGWDNMLALNWQMVRDAPDGWRAWSNLATELARPPADLERLNEAVAAGERAYEILATRPTWVKWPVIANAGLLHMMRGDAHFAAGNADAATSDWARSIDLNLAAIRVGQTDNPAAERNVVFIQHEIRHESQGEQKPQRQARLYGYVVYAFYRLNRFDLAVMAGESGRCYSELSVDKLAYYGRSLANVGRLSKAEAVLRQVVELDSHSEAYQRDLETVVKRSSRQAE